MTMMNSPYRSACDTPLAREPPFLVKKLTVSGTIGKMQGIMKAAKPPSSPAMKMPQRDCLPSALASTDTLLAVPSSASSPAVPSSKTRSSGTSSRVSLSPSASTKLSVNSTSSNEIKLSCCANDELYKESVKICSTIRYLNNERIAYLDKSLK